MPRIREKRRLTPVVKEQIKIKYKYVCQLCLNEFKTLEIHHIDQDRTNNELNNLIPLCKDCHRNRIHINKTLGLVDKELTELLIKRIMEGSSMKDRLAEYFMSKLRMCVTLEDWDAVFESLNEDRHPRFMEYFYTSPKHRPEFTRLATALLNRNMILTKEEAISIFSDTSCTLKRRNMNYVSHELRFDHDVILAAVKGGLDPNLIDSPYIKVGPRDDYDFMLKLLREGPISNVKHASVDLLENYNFVVEALKIDKTALEHIPKNHIKDPQLKLASKSKEYLELLLESIRDNDVPI